MLMLLAAPAGLEATDEPRRAMGFGFLTWEKAEGLAPDESEW
jgi:hypothetical protein